MTNSTVIYVSCCALISVTIIAQLTYSINNTFKTLDTRPDIKKATFGVFIGYIIWSVTAATSQAIEPFYVCPLWNVLITVPFIATRFAIYYFFIVRTENTFRGSVLAFKSEFIQKLKTFIVFVYILWAVLESILGFFRVHHDEGCSFEPNTVWLYIYRIKTLTFCAIDFGLGLYINITYLRRLWNIHKHFNAMELAESQQNAEQSSTSNSSNELLLIIKKQSKLVFISYLSTMFLIYNTITIFTLYIDGIVNALCVYCTFAVKQKHYDVLCNCNGNKRLLCVFCFCCYCCNTVTVTDENASKGGIPQSTDTTSEAPSKTLTVTVSADTNTDIDMVLH